MTVTPKTILVVEDDDFLIGALKIRLEQENFILLEASDGEQGLEIAMQEKPALIVTDIMMPILDGIEMVKEIRKDEDWGSEVPVIFLTNIGSPGREDEADMLKSDYMIKANSGLAEVIDRVESKLG